MKRSLIYVLLMLANKICFSQQIDCTNIGFEEGSFRGWIRSNGELDVLTDSLQLRFVDEQLGTIDQGHYITQQSDGNDPLIIQEPIPMVAPGSRYSIRIGNSKVGAKFDRIQTSLQVTVDNALFQYKFAVVLQNPNHKPLHQPALRIRIMSTNGGSIPCGTYEVSAAKTIAGFSNQGNLRYRNWTNGLIDLRSYIGQKLIIQVTTNDCAEGAHFGYAYFDAQCLPAIITASSYCAARDTTLVLTAPAGFGHYEWNTGDTTQLLSIKPRTGDQYWVKISSYSSVSEDCQLQLAYQVGVPQPPLAQSISLCAGEAYHIGDSTYSSSGTYTTSIKRTAPYCDSLVLTHLIIKPVVSSTQQVSICAGQKYVLGNNSYSQTGTYMARIPRSSPLCDSIVNLKLFVRPLPPVTVQEIAISLGDSVQLLASLPRVDDYVYSWLPPEGLSCLTCVSPWAKPAQTTHYQLLISTKNPVCVVNQPVTIQVSPCRIYIPDAFSPNADGVHDIFSVVATPCLRQVAIMTIYSRWGEVLFHQEHIALSELPSGWQGLYKGQPVSAGQYTYLIKTISINGQSSWHRGTLTLIR